MFNAEEMKTFMENIETENLTFRANTLLINCEYLWFFFNKTNYFHRKNDNRICAM